MTKRLSLEQVDFLRSPDTLKSWSGYSLEARCRLFHRQYPETKITRYLLHKLYQAYGIKRKKL